MRRRVPAPVPADEVFSPEQIGHALSAPTPEAGHTAPSAANAPADDGQWTMPSKNYASTRYSSLTELTPHNVKRLQPIFTFSLGVNKGQEAAPIVADNTMYVVTAYPNYRVCTRSDQARRAAQVEIRAQARCPPSQGVACCDVVNRGGTVRARASTSSTRSTDRSLRSTSKTGKPVWRTRLGNINAGETITMAPLVAKGDVYVGDSGGELGVRGWLAALDEDSGKLLWKAYNTGPDSDVLIGADFQPFYASDRGKDLGVSPGRRRPGRSAAAPSGAGSTTTPT